MPKQFFPDPERLKPHFSLKNMQPISPYKGPKKILYEIYNEIDRRGYFGARKSWEVMIDLLAHHLGIMTNPWLYSKPALDVRIADGPMMIRLGYKQNQGFRLPQKILKYRFPPAQLSREAQDMLPKVGESLLEEYVTVAREDPWDYIGDIFTEDMLAGRENRLGQCLTPKQIVDFMVQMTLGTVDAKKPRKEPITDLDPAVGTGRFLIEASLMFPEKPLILFGIEIDITLYRACLVNMALFSNHPYSIIRADTLMISDPRESEIWNYGNLWDPADVSQFYVKIPPPFKFSLREMAKARKEAEAEGRSQEPTPIVMPQAPLVFSLAEFSRGRKKRT